jgi:hypothetical protein
MSCSNSDPDQILADADGLLASVGDQCDAVSLVDLGKFQYIRLRLLSGLEWSAIN